MSETLTLSNGRPIPQLGFGTWQITGSEAVRTVGWALEAGYRHVDTASFYQNEAEIGQAVSDSGVPRAEIFVTSKVFPSQFFNVPLAFKNSLERLNLDYLDLYLIHWPPPIGGERIWQQLERFYAAGQVKAIGVSNYDHHRLERLLAACRVKPMVNQIQINPWHYPVETIEFCRQHNIVVEAYSPLAHGHRLDDPRLAKLAGEVGRRPAQVLIRWNLQHGWVSLPKSANHQRIAENAQVFDFELSAQAMDELDHFLVKIA